MAKLNITIAGATGETGSSVLKALLSTPEQFAVTTIARPSSLTKDAWVALKNRGVRIVAADLAGSVQELTKLLTGTDIVISCLHYSPDEEKALATAAKNAGVGRFVPSFWTTVAPRGVMSVRDSKEDVLDHVQRLYLPYTAIDVGWWYQISLPSLPSGRIVVSLPPLQGSIIGDGSVPGALIDKDDVGRFVARIITDSRTLNRKVFAYGAVLSQNEIWSLLEQVSGEKAPREYETGEQILAQIEAGHLAASQDPSAITAVTPSRMQIVAGQYKYSIGIRGDNTPEHAKYLGYLDARELYPDLEPSSFKSYVERAVEGNTTKVYAGRGTN